MQFYGISVMHPYKQSSRRQNVIDQAHSAIDQTAYMDGTYSIWINLRYMILYLFETVLI